MTDEANKQRTVTEKKVKWRQQTILADAENVLQLLTNVEDKTRRFWQARIRCDVAKEDAKGFFREEINNDQKSAIATTMSLIVVIV